MLTDSTGAETVWVVPEVNDLGEVLAYELQQAGNQNVDLDASDFTELIAQPYDPAKPDRRGFALQFAITEFRQAVLNAGRIPVSQFQVVNPDKSVTYSLPPEVVRCCLQHAAYNLLSSTVSLKTVIVTENGVYTPFNKLQQEAKDLLAKLRAGAVVSLPSNPASTVIPLTGGSGDIDAPYDMTWDGNTNPVPS